MEFNRNDQTEQTEETEHEMCFYKNNIEEVPGGILLWVGSNYTQTPLMGNLGQVSRLVRSGNLSRQHQSDWVAEIDLMVFSAQCWDNS